MEIVVLIVGFSLLLLFVAWQKRKPQLAFTARGSNGEEKEFPAWGDGFHSDAEAFFAASQHAEEVGGSIYTPPGTFNIAHSEATTPIWLGGPSKFTPFSVKS